jgi:hypothetical protein
MNTITIPRALLEQALEALENCTSEHGHRCNRCDSEVDEGGRVVTALRTALAQQEQEPVAWMVYTQDGKSVCVTDNPADFTDEHRALPLYTHPPRRAIVRAAAEIGRSKT